MWDGMGVMYDYFEELAEAVAGGLGYPYDQKEAESVKKFWQERRKNETQKGG